MRIPRLRKNGSYAIIHTREDLALLMQAHNELCDYVEHLENKINKLKNEIKMLKDEKLN